MKAKELSFYLLLFDKKKYMFFKKVNLKRWKIPSGEINNIPYLRLIGSYGEPIILSTGMSDLEEISGHWKLLKLQELIEINYSSTMYNCISSSYRSNKCLMQ